MTQHLTLDLLLRVAERACGTPVQVRDYGLLESALARPAATVFGADAYPTVRGKAAALLHSLAGNQAIVDGNKRQPSFCGSTSTTSTRPRTARSSW